MKQRIIMTKGLPGSGKSTWAKMMLEENPGIFKRINKDDLRRMFDNGKWSKNNEQFIVFVRDNLILLSLARGFSVIVDDTNLHPKHKTQLRELAESADAEFEIQDFTNVPLEICIKQDLLRFDSVGKDVIMQWYNQFLKPKAPEIKYDPNLPDAIICDIDGTLALFGDASPYDRDFLKDEVNEPVKSILNSNTGGMETRTILVSGRKDKFRKQTEEWLSINKIPYDELFMRKTAPEGQQEPKDVIVKQEIYEQNIRGKYNVLFVLDDRNQVVDFWRSQGLTCLQVAEGDF